MDTCNLFANRAEREKIYPHDSAYRPFHIKWHSLIRENPHKGIEGLINNRLSTFYSDHLHNANKDVPLNEQINVYWPLKAQASHAPVKCFQF